MSEIEYFKNVYAKQHGYANWEEFYNWVARDGEIPSVVAQQIEAAMNWVCLALIK